MGNRLVALLNGPNMSNLGRRDPHIYGTIESLDTVERLVASAAAQFGLSVDSWQDNDEGALVDHIDDCAGRYDGYLINPGGLWAYGDPARLALAATGRPVVEVHFANIHATGNRSVFSHSVDGTVMGLRQYGYVGAIAALACALEDKDA